MLINKAYVFRMYPSVEQKKLINQTIGSSRFVYNYFLSQRQEEYKNSKTSKNAYEECKQLNNMYKDYTWLTEVDSCALRNAIFNLDDAYQRFYKGSGYPKIKKRRISGSYKTNCIRSSYKGVNYSNIEIDLNKKVIKLPKLKEVKIIGYRSIKSIEGRIINATIKREGNKYYCVLLYEQIKEEKEYKPSNIIGIDLGIKDLITTSRGIKINNSIEVEKIDKKIKGIQRWLARSIPGSKNRYKIQLKLKRLYQKLKNKRKYMMHEITNKIIKGNDLIITEDLDVKNMYQKKTIARLLPNNPFGEIIRMLEYKCIWNNKRLIKVNRWYKSSQTCSVCGNVDKKYKDLGKREYKCEHCKSEIDRDINASLNIEWEGLIAYYKEQIV